MRSTASRTYAFATVALVAIGAVMAIIHTPDDPALGAARHALYLHLPFAINAYLWCVVAFAAAVAFLATRDPRWDRLEAAAVAGAAAATTVLLATGMVLARCAWGQWWVWSPKLTFSLVLGALLAIYLAIRLCIRTPARRAVVAAVYAAVATLDAPLVYLSVKLLPDVHPVSVDLDAGARITLLVCLLAVTLACGRLVASAARGPLADGETGAQARMSLETAPPGTREGPRIPTSR